MHDFSCDLLILPICDVDDVLAVGVGEVADLRIGHFMQVDGLVHFDVEVSTLLFFDCLLQSRLNDFHHAFSDGTGALVPILSVLRIEIEEVRMRVIFPLERGLQGRLNALALLLNDGWGRFLVD